MADDEVEQDFKNLELYQSMIDISADRLEGLRTKCATSAELTRQEIRTLEGKLIKLFSRQLVVKTKLRMDDLKNIPSLTQWLEVVGLSKESIQGVCQKVSSLEELKEKSEHELRTILNEKNARPEEFGRLHRALHNLRRYTEVLQRDDAAPVDTVEMALYWDSWDRHHQLKNNVSPRTGVRSRATRASVPSEECLPYGAAINNNAHRIGIGIGIGTGIGTLGGSVSTLVPSCSVSSINSLVLSSQPAQCSPTPPLTPPVLTKGKAGEKVKFPTTPPPRKKHLTGMQSTILLPDAYPLTKSQSHEFQLTPNKIDNGDTNNSGRIEQSGTVGRRARLPTEPGLGVGDQGYNSPLVSSPIKSPPYNSGATGADSDDSSYKSTSLQVPKSPRTPTVSRGMGHVIAHRFTKTFKVMTVCNFCNRQMFGTGLKCKECKYKCHRECEAKVPPSCGLPQEFVDEFKKSFQSDVFQSNQSPNLLRIASPNQNNLLTSLRHYKRSHQQPSINIPPFPGPDSSSNTSSCNSSTPSSPALLPAHTPHAHTKQQQFHFPDVAGGGPYGGGGGGGGGGIGVGGGYMGGNAELGVTIETHPLLHGVLVLEDPAETTSAHDSERTVSVSGSGSVSTDSDRTPVRVDSQDSQVSDSETITDRDAHRWPRQNSLSMREWDIPFDELKIGEPIGTGRFGTVYRGNWHGDVAIKVLNMDYLDDEKALETFKMEVGTFRKTRHENLMLFMGACMKPPRLAIVTSLSKGMTLYTHIHLRKDKFNMNRTTIIAQQISQGMGYLHAKGIVHKDLKSKNIFLENGKVVIADFGLFSVTKLCFGNRKGDSLGIPPGWLCYLAPEIVRSLRAHQAHDEELPFTKASDVYAFGTVWYELLCGEWPFKGQPPESIIWQVGQGMKQPLANLQASRDVKDILMLCWSFRPNDRPDFISLLNNTLNKLPKKRLARSPSHPIHLSRSAESVF